jgi:hypothetical protein
MFGTFRQLPSPLRLLPIPLAELKGRVMKAFDLEDGRDGRKAVLGADWGGCA